MYYHVVKLMLTNVSEVCTASLMMEAIGISQTLVSINLTTHQYIPEDSRLQVVSCLNGATTSKKAMNCCKKTFNITK
jgi:hypothetical protein